MHMKYSPTEALKLLDGITRKRLYEMMKNGELSYTSENNKRFLDASELARVFNEKFRPQETKEILLDTEKKQNDTFEIHIENRLLKQQIEELQKRISDKDRENERLWENLDKEAEERRKLTDTLSKQTLMLEDMRMKQPEKLAERRKGFFARLVS
ncbi:MAG: hypothetical protein RL596_1707 [Bacteroidota bacterium]